MVRNLLATTAIAALMTTGALAQDDMQSNETMNKPLFNSEQDNMMESDTGFYAADKTQILASDLLGKSVYNGAGDDADSVGDVNDVLMGPDGEAEAVVIGVGGFLGIGEKEVAVDFERISWVDRDGSRWLIIDSSKEELEGAPAFDRTAFEPQPDETEQMAATDNTDMMAADPEMTEATEQAAIEDERDAESDMDTAAIDEEPAADEQTDMAAADEEPVAEETDTAEVYEGSETQNAMDNAAVEDDQVDPNQTAAINPETWTAAGELRAEDMIGTRVYGANDEDIGEIGDVIVTADGGFEAYIVDVGGFLGIGEKEVALGASELEVMKDADGWLHIRTQFTEEELESQAAYDEETYEENRDSVILR